MERLVISARRRARQETAHLVSPLLTAGTKQLLDSLLVVDQASGRTPLTRLRTGAVSASPKAILDTLAKVQQLEEWHVKQWDVRSLSPNRRHLLARIAQRATAQALERMGAGRRYPILLAFLHDVFEDRADESVDLFDKCLSEAYASAGNELKELRLAAARSANEKVILLRDISSILLDMRVDDSDVRWFIFKRVSRERLEKASTECEALMRPLRDDYFDLFATRYSHFRQFAPAFLDVLHFAAGREDDPLLAAIEFLRKLEKEKARSRTLSAEDVPTAFVPANWKPYVFAADGNVNRRHYELALLWELRAALRAGDIWLAHSRRYANPKSYLIPQDRWPEWRPAVCDLLGGAPAEGAERLHERKTQLEEMFRCVDQKLPNYGSIRMEDNKLVVDRIRAEEDAPSLKALNDEVDARLPVTSRVRGSRPAGCWNVDVKPVQESTSSSRSANSMSVHCYASLIAQARNLGLVRMAQASDLTYMKLAWVTTWYLRDETLKAANVKLVNYHHHLPLSGVWGGGTLSSSDGQRFPSSVKNVMAAAQPPYYGYGRGLTLYTWTSDQHSQYGSKPASSLIRDATYVLDEILDNETELPILEHTTDTAGYTDLVFALFDLLGLQFSPRLRDIGDQRLFRIDPAASYHNLDPLLTGNYINTELILKYWDDLLRVAGSLKVGWVTASLFIAKLQSYRRNNALTRALQGIRAAGQDDLHPAMAR